MRSENGNLHLEIQTSRKSPVGIIRTTQWDKDLKKYIHTQHGRISGCSINQLKLLQAAFREEVVPGNAPEAFHILRSREYGASQAILNLAKETGLDKMLYSRTEPWVDCVLAMIVGRIVYQGSKLSLCNRWENTALWELCGVEGKPVVEKHCYAPLDRLLSRQKAIQKKLAKKHLTSGSMLLYDITSSYFEGEYESSELVTFGYNRDGKKGHEQVVIGLITTEEGCPVGCEVFKGNTSDSTTVMGKIDEARRQYGLEKFIFVGDRGMVTQGRFEEIREHENINSISALTHAQLNELLKRNVVQPELFDEKSTVEIIDPEDGALRYCLCKNPVTRQREHDTRLRLVQLVETGMEEIAGYKKKTTVEKLGARVGKLLAKYKVGKFVTWSIEAEAGEIKSCNHKIKWRIDQHKIEAEEQLDGCYIIRTDVGHGRMDTDSVVDAYKSLGNVERAFRNLKTVQLEMRPMYHKTDDRIRAHVFLCMLSYYVQWHLMKRLQPLFEGDGVGSDRRWSFELVIETLRQRVRHTVSCQDITFERNGEPTPAQQTIIDLLAQSI